MRSLHVFALVAGAAVAGAACGGGDGGNGPSNSAPVAAFTPACTLLACTFTDASSDPNSGDNIASYAWNFGDGATSTDASPTHTYAAPGGTFHVTLRVTDNHGLASALADSTITVSDQPPANQPPTAAFNPACSSLDCTFTDQSTDADGTIASRAWDFGDGATSTETSPPHSYTASAPDTFTVRLIATDNAGAADTVTHNVVVAPPATCEGAACNLTLQADAKVRVTLTSEDCSAPGNTLRITMPVDTTLFTNGCNTPAGTSFEIVGGTANVFSAGTTILPEVISGSQDLAFPPTLRLRAGTAYPTWILEFDDGESGDCPGDPTCGGKEPDFNDLIITIEAHQ